MLEWLFGQRKGLLKKEVSTEEFQWLDSAIWQAQHFTRQQREQWIRWCRVFISEKSWEGCEGLVVSDLMKWRISAAAGMMVLGYPDWYFDRTATILIYPRPYTARVEPPIFSSTFNATLGGEFRRAGETIYRGPVVLNWQDIQSAAADANQGHHLIVHEFSHQLDLINGPAADGLPPLPDGIDEDRWRKAMRAEYEVARDRISQGHRILMDDYGLTHESEFFAVASELYFQGPNALQEFHPNVYGLLKQFYLIDTATILPS